MNAWSPCHDLIYLLYYYSNLLKHKTIYLVFARFSLLTRPEVEVEDSEPGPCLSPRASQPSPFKYRPFDISTQARVASSPKASLVTAFVIPNRREAEEECGSQFLFEEVSTSIG